MKHFLLRTVAYCGLYSEIFSALCRWFSKPDCWGRRKPWRTVVTKSLVAAGYLPPTRGERNAAQAQQQINNEHAVLTWFAKQPETIQACLKSFDPSLLEKFYRWKKPVEIYPVGERDLVVPPPELPNLPATPNAPAIPKFIKLPEGWATINSELDEDGYLK